MNRDEKKQEKRAVILDAARQEFLDKRFDEVKLQDIAARAGVGKGTLYLYFKNKDDLFLHVAVDGIDEMAARIHEIRELDLSFRERFFMLGAEMAENFVRRDALMRMMDQSANEWVRRGFGEYRKKMVEATGRFMQAGVTEGALRSDCDISEMDIAFIGPLALRSRILKSGRKVCEETLLKIIWDGIVKR